MYTNQSIRVKWGNTTGHKFAVSNGVKQGGVISPLLFTLYIDNLLERLRAVGVGCYIGKTLYGAFGYADDLILLTPNVRSLNTFLNVCKEYAIEYNVSFNPEKSKSVIMSHSQSSPFVPEISFMNDHIEVVRYDKHLGNYTGNISQDEIISRMIKDFRTRVNMVKSHFKSLPIDVMYFYSKRIVCLYMVVNYVILAVQQLQNCILHGEKLFDIFSTFLEELIVIYMCTSSDLY